MSGYMMSEIKAAVALHRDGVYVKDIAQSLGRSPGVVTQMLKYGGCAPSKGPRPTQRTAELRARPIDVCREKAAQDHDAATGSAMLLEAIMRAGVRPS